MKKKISYLLLKVIACMILVLVGIAIGVIIVVQTLLGAINFSKEESTTEFWNLRVAIAREVDCEPEEVILGSWNGEYIACINDGWFGPKPINFDDSKVEKIIDRQIAGNDDYADILAVQMSMIDGKWQMTTDELFDMGIGIEPTS